MSWYYNTGVYNLNVILNCVVSIAGLDFETLSLTKASGDCAFLYCLEIFVNISYSLRPF